MPSLQMSHHYSPQSDEVCMMYSGESERFSYFLQGKLLYAVLLMLLCGVCRK